MVAGCVLWAQGAAAAALLLNQLVGVVSTL
jgi:hypothetical protein